MKKLLGIVVLTFFMCGSAMSLDRNELSKLMSKSKTSYAASHIEDYCAGENAAFEFMYGASCKCAIKAGKANNKYAASEILDQCGL
tara:strand:+ start:633 stop:890 length:258 start_codon:yes stop_codon:yes gene_type:complete